MTIKLEKNIMDNQDQEQEIYNDIDIPNVADTLALENKSHVHKVLGKHSKHFKQENLLILETLHRLYHGSDVETELAQLKEKDILVYRYISDVVFGLRTEDEIKSKVMKTIFKRLTPVMITASTSIMSGNTWGFIGEYIWNNATKARFRKTEMNKNWVYVISRELKKEMSSDDITLLVAEALMDAVVEPISFTTRGQQQGLVFRMAVNTGKKLAPRVDKIAEFLKRERESGRTEWYDKAEDRNGALVWQPNVTKQSYIFAEITTTLKQNGYSNDDVDRITDAIGRGAFLDECSEQEIELVQGAVQEWMEFLRRKDAIISPATCRELAQARNKRLEKLGDGYDR